MQASPGLVRAVGFLDGISLWSGRIVAWLIIPMVMSLVWEVVARYFFNAPTVWAYDMTYMLYGSFFMLGSAYTLLRGKHIRTDSFYGQWPARRQGLVDAVCYLILFFPPLLALLYVDSHEPHFCDAHDIERLSKFSRIVAKSVHDTASPRSGGATADSWEAYLERTPVEDMEREKLLLLLNRNEWNIARVARMMGVTRRTVYLRLQRYNIPRERVPKSRLKSAS